MKNQKRHGCLAALVLVIVLLAFGCSHDEEEENLIYDPDKEPFKIGICVPVSGETDEYSKQVFDGIRMAHEINGVIDNTKITLVMKDACEINDLNAFCEVMMQEGLQGIIYSAGEPKQNIPVFDAKADQGSFAVMAASSCMNPKTDVRVFRLGSTLIDQARVAALFAVRSLGAGSVAVVLDQKSSSCVLLASLFSSELIDAGGRIVNIAYVGDDEKGLESSVESMMQRNPDVIYMPYSEETSFRVISLAKGNESSAGMIISNVLFERKFLDKGGKDLDGIYLITDFYPGAVQSKRGEALIKRYASKRREPRALETSGALSSDAYFFLCDLLAQRPGPDALEDVVGFITNMETITGINGVSTSGRLTKNMHVSQVRAGIIRGIRLIYKESINPL